MEANKENLEGNVNVQEELFKGYSLEELRYQRALTSLRADFCKEKLLAEVGSIVKKSPLSRSKLNGTGIAGKLMKSLNFIDYAVIGLTIFKTVKSIINRFRK